MVRRPARPKARSIELNDNWNSIVKYWKTVALSPKQINSDILRQCALKLRAASRCILPHRLADESAMARLDMLALALIFAAEICEAASSERNTDLVGLFDGGEPDAPNLYTRMKAVRDLCSAALWSIQVRSDNASYPNDDHVSGRGKPDAALWRELVSEFGDNCDARVADEVVALLDDTFGSLLAASQLLESSESDSLDKWTEIHRHIMHVRDHFDYAEEFLIATLRKSRE